MGYRNSAWLLALVLLASAAESAQLELVSGAALPAPALSNGASRNARASADLRYVVFESYADNLVAGDSNRRGDIVLVDRVANTRAVISRTAAAAADGDSFGADISADGNTIVFSSAASNLVADDSNQQTDVFVLNRLTGDLRRLLPGVGVQPDGLSREARISDNGQRIAFTSNATNWVGDDSNGVADVFVYDLAGNTVQRASLTSASLEASGYIGMPDINLDGSCVLFHAVSGDFVPGDQNGTQDVFVRDLGEQETSRVSIGFDGRESEQVVSGSGRIIDCGTAVFASFDGDLAFPDMGPGVWLYRHSPGSTDLVYDISTTNFSAANYALSRSGLYLMFGLEFDALEGISDLQRINLSNLSVTALSGRSGLPGVIADDGGTVIAHSEGSLTAADRNVIEDMFLATFGGSFEVLSTPASAAPVLVANGASGRADHADPLTPGAGTRTQSISGDGNLVLFNSLATNIVAGDTNDFEDVFLRDRSSGTTTRLSLAPGGVQGNGLSRANDISADGRFVTFESCASNLVAGDGNALCDAFLLDRQTQAIERINVSSAGIEANGQGDPIRGHWSRVSDDGRYVVFVSTAINLVAGTSTVARRVYLRDRQTSTTSLISPGRSPAITADGRYVAYASNPGIRLWDRQSGLSEDISIGVGAAPEDNFSDWPSLSDDGRHVAFYSNSSNLVVDDANGEADVFVRDRQLATTTLVSRQVGAAEQIIGGSIAEISADGRYVVYVPGLSSVGDFFDSRGMLCDLQTGEIKSFVALSDVVNGRYSIMRPRISADGSTVVFAAFGLNRSAVDISGDIPDVFVSTGTQNYLFGDDFE
jgi:Tol biopolymer transport system component